MEPTAAFAPTSVVAAAVGFRLKVPALSTILPLPKGVAEAATVLLRRVPAPSLVNVKVAPAMGVINCNEPPLTAPIVELLPRVTAPVMAMPTVAAPLTSAPALLRPVPLIVSVPIVSVPVERRSKVPPELTVFAAVSSRTLVTAPVAKNLPPALTTIFDVLIRPVVISTVPASMINVPALVPPAVVFEIANVPVPVLVRAPFIVTAEVEVVKVAPEPTLSVAPPAAMVIAPDQVVARFGSRMRAPPLLTPVPLRDSSSPATVPPMPTRSAPPLMTSVPLPDPAVPRAVRLVTRRVPLLMLVVPV